MNENNYEQYFSEMFPFWNHITSEQQAMLINSTAKGCFEKNEIVHGGDSSCTGSILVIKGCIRAYILSENGKEITLYRLFPGDICMLSASCVIKAITFDVFFDTQEYTECLIINGITLEKISSENIEVENYALNVAVKRFSDVMSVMQKMLFMSIESRLASFLCEESNRTNSNTIEMTHEQIAKNIGSAREVISRTIKNLSSENIVKLNRGGIEIINKQRLEDLVSK